MSQRPYIILLFYVRFMDVSCWHYNCAHTQLSGIMRDIHQSQSLDQCKHGILRIINLAMCILTKYKSSKVGSVSVSY